MATGLINPFTLRFRSDYLEAAFFADYARRSVVLVRAALFLGFFQLALFGLLDRLMVPEAFRDILIVRGVACAVVLGFIAYTYAPAFRRRMQAVLVGPPLAAGLAVAVMAVVGQQSNDYYDYYAGLILVLIYVHVLLRLRFVLASAVGNVLIVVFLAVTALLGTPSAALLNTSFFLLSANATGMIASYALERYARLQFLQARRQERTNRELAGVLEGLRAAQARLVQQEKMASLGRLTAGVAHEIKNPLNFVNNFADLSVELADEVAEVLAGAGERPADEVFAEVSALVDDLRVDVAKIREHGGRADAIVRSMQDHAGVRQGERQPAPFNALVEEQARFALDAFLARYRGFAPALDLDLAPAVGLVPVVPQEVGRVVTNLVNNALYAVYERGRRAAGGDGAPYAPAVTVRTRAEAGAVVVEVEDNGAGIPAAIREHIFEPFFTTKPTGTGTGLGLSLAYDVVTQGHGGTLAFETEEGQGTRFVVTLPVPASPPAAAPGPAAPEVAAASA
jgi:signal transduction histidine kinase